MSTSPTYLMLDRMAAISINNGALAKHTLPQFAVNHQHALMSGFGSSAFSSSGYLAASSSIRLAVRIPLNVIHARVFVLCSGDGFLKVQSYTAGGSNLDDVGSKILVSDNVGLLGPNTAKIYEASIPYQNNNDPTSAEYGIKLDQGTNMVLKVATSAATSWDWIDLLITTNAGVELHGIALHWELENAA